MRKFWLSISLGLSLIVGAAAASAQVPSAQKGNVTFYLTNQTPYGIMIKFFSQTRNWVWPDGTRHWTLDDDQQHAFPFLCEVGERICYGGAYTPDKGGGRWGVGFSGTSNCDGCCLICGNNISHHWSLIPANAAHLGDRRTSVLAEIGDLSLKMSRPRSYITRLRLKEQPYGAF